MKWTRRNFLKRAGLGVAALAGSEAGLALLADRCGSVLASPGPRKLALLVGINRYPENVADFAWKGTALNGCLTDVELQRMLLIHRFGFAAADIVTLTDQQATRAAIETAFVEHLLGQAEAGDVVVFHFSGLGSRVAIADTTQNTLVPIDGTLPTEEDPTLKDLPETTLWALLRSLPTTQVLTVLDAGYRGIGAPLQGNLRVRSRPNAPVGQLLESEQQFLTTLQDRPGNRLIQPAAVSQLPGIYLRAATPEQVALEGQWENLSAGLLTYTLTQQLWSQTQSQQLWIPLREMQSQVRQQVGAVQQPILQVTASAAPAALKTEGSPAEGVVTAIEPENRVVQIWLAGLPARVLESYGVGTLLAPAGSEMDTPPLLQIRSRDGLNARATIRSDQAADFPAIGQVLWERVRLLPRSIGLTVALDSSLERIERVDATSAFATARVAVVAAGEQSADYVFGKVAIPVLSAALPVDLQPQNSTAPADVPSVQPASRSKYGLFSPGRGSIPGGISQGEKSIKTAVNQLTPQVRSLLAIKLLRLTQNAASSQLGVQVRLTQRNEPQHVLWQQKTARVSGAPPTNPAAMVGAEAIPKIPAGTSVQFQVLNPGDRPLHALLLGWDGMGKAIALSTDPENPILPDRPQLLPGNGWQVQNTPELTEWFWIFSPSPLSQTLALLNSDSNPASLPPFILLTEPLTLVQTLLQDLNAISREVATAEAWPLEFPADAYVLDVRQWATLTCLYDGEAV